MLHTHLYLKLLLTEGQRTEAWGAFNKSDALLEIREHQEGKVVTLFFEFCQVK
jgi:hypothetical protein